MVTRVSRRTRGFGCRGHVELSNWCCNLSSEQMTSFYKKVLEYITLISPPTVIIDRYSITARITEYACGKLMHLFIEFLFASQASSHKFVFPSKKRSPQSSSRLFLSVFAHAFSWHSVRCSVDKSRPLISSPSKRFDHWPIFGQSVPLFELMPLSWNNVYTPFYGKASLMAEWCSYHPWELISDFINPHEILWALITEH